VFVAYSFFEAAKVAKGFLILPQNRIKKPLNLSRIQGFLKVV